MNKHELEGKWNQAKGKVKEKWGKLTEDDLKVIDGKSDQLVGRLQERYGYSKEQAERECEHFCGSL
ncbi:MAG: CsbD family protein [Planctomycetota bacterium]|nr:MAG: CsbD family protein [Planctomycetota bacterium]